MLTTESLCLPCPAKHCLVLQSYTLAIHVVSPASAPSAQTRTLQLCVGPPSSHRPPLLRPSCCTHFCILICHCPGLGLLPSSHDRHYLISASPIMTFPLPPQIHLSLGKTANSSTALHTKAVKNTLHHVGCTSPCMP